MQTKNANTCHDSDDRVDRDFLLIVFQEINDHVRNTEQKYLIITAAYIGLISVVISTFNEAQVAGSNVSFHSGIFSSLSHFFFLLIGMGVYVMQVWYRTWKEHYLKVCLEIKQYFVQVENSSSLFPYWLRKDITKLKARVLIDNSMKYLTLSTNILLAALITVEVNHLIRNKFLMIGFDLFIILCLVIPVFVERKIRNEKFLLA